LGVQIQAHRIIGMSYLSGTDYYRAVDHLNKSLELLEGQSSRNLFGFASTPAVNSRVFRAWSQAELGKFSEAKNDADEAVRIAEALEHPASQSLAYWAAGIVHLGKGDFGTAMRSLEHALKTAKDTNLPLLLQYLERSAGRAYAHTAQLNEATLLLETAVERARSINQMAHYALTLVAIGEAYLLAGRPQEAAANAKNALELASDRNEPGHRAYAFQLLAEIASHPEQTELDKAENYYRQAMDLADSQGMRPLLARCHLGLGLLNRKREKSEPAKEHLSTAITLFREMEMTPYLEKAESLMKELSLGR
jgi:tetratricopeptide (TPR) repeat protein